MRRYRSTWPGTLIAIVVYAAASVSKGDDIAPRPDATGRSPRGGESNPVNSTADGVLDGRIHLSEEILRKFGEFDIVALARGNQLLRHSVGRGDRWSRTAVTGVRGNLIGSDWRPADGVVYGINDGNDLYRVDPDSGQAERVSSLTVGFEGSESSAFDFDPQADRLRLIAASGQNLRVQVTLGAVAADGPLEFAPGARHAGAQPRVTAAAYTNNVSAAPTTRLFDIDWRLDALLFQDPPNDGVVQTLGPLGVDFDELGAFDILTGPSGDELAIAVSGRRIYRLDLERGSAHRIGSIGSIEGNDTQVIGISMFPTPRRSR